MIPFVEQCGFAGLANVGCGSSCNVWMNVSDRWSAVHVPSLQLPCAEDCHAQHVWLVWGLCKFWAVHDYEFWSRIDIGIDQVFGTHMNVPVQGTGRFSEHPLFCGFGDIAQNGCYSTLIMYRDLTAWAQTLSFMRWVTPWACNTRAQLLRYGPCFRFDVIWKAYACSMKT
jgi:hypothetical protein